MLLELKYFYNKGNEIIIIDDGSNDGSQELLLDYDFINFIQHKSNQGKGIAIRKGLAKASKDAIIIFDGDLELDPADIKKLMILNKSQGLECVFGIRSTKLISSSLIWDFGNSIFTKIFNIINKSDLKDALCCAKSFYKTDLNIKNLKSIKFDIDVEIASSLISKNLKINEVSINYSRRKKIEGKKLRIFDSIDILKQILMKN